MKSITSVLPPLRSHLNKRIEKLFSKEPFNSSLCSTRFDDFINVCNSICYRFCKLLLPFSILLSENSHFTQLIEGKNTQTINSLWKIYHRSRDALRCAVHCVWSLRPENRYNKWLDTNSDMWTHKVTNSHQATNDECVFDWKWLRLWFWTWRRVRKR